MSIISKDKLGLAKFLSKITEFNYDSLLYLNNGDAVITDRIWLMIVRDVKKFPLDDYVETGLEDQAVKDEEPVLIHKGTAEKVLKNFPKKSVSPEYLSQYSFLAKDSGKIKFWTTDVENENIITQREVDDIKYPDYRAVIPTEKPVISQTIDVKELMDILKAAQQTGIDKLKIEMRENNKPLRVTGKSEMSEFEAVLMPMREGE